jgi:hypothetical protein
MIGDFVKGKGGMGFEPRTLDFFSIHDKVSVKGWHTCHFELDASFARLNHYWRDISIKRRSSKDPFMS